MKHTLVLMLLLAAVLGMVRQTPAGVIDDRLDQLVTIHVTNPWPDPDAADGGTACWGLSAYALAALHTNQDLTTANDYINTLHDDYNVPTGDTIDFDCYFKLNLIWRIYCDPDMNARLTATARDNIEDMMWRWIDARSKLSDAQGSVWRIADSENHDAMQKTGYLLCAQALKNAGSPYSPTQTLADGHTIQEHHDAWTQYWQTYFVERAKEGINCEIASPTYAKYTLGTYYNIRDFAESAELRDLAEDMLNLYWAEVAVDYLPTGVRGGAETRCYKDASLQTSPGGLYSVAWAYAWPSTYTLGSGNPFELLMATSDYRVPAIINAIANDTSKSPYMYTSRKFGMGGGWDGNQVYTVDFDNGNSHMRRDSYVTPGYVMGTITLDPARGYISLIDQNRAMGVFFSANVNDRIAVHGRAADDRTSYTDLWGMTGVNCSVIARDPGAAGNSIGTRVFIPSGDLWNNRVEESGWFFTYTDGAYCALRPATGGYTATPVSNGVMLELQDMWAPVIIQMGKPEDYMELYTFFKNDVKDNTLTYSSGLLTYHSCAGDVYEFWANSTTLPKLNGTTVNLNPTKTYDSPYLNMQHGQQTVTVSYGSYDDLVLDFNPQIVCGSWGYLDADFDQSCYVDYGDLDQLAAQWLADSALTYPPTQPRPDTETHSGLWRFESYLENAGEVFFPDNDTAVPARDAHLQLMEGTTKVATIGDGPLSVNPISEGIGYPDGNAAYGNCAFFAGQNEHCRIANTLLPIDTGNLRIEGWLRVADALQYNPAVADWYMVFDRWGQVLLRLLDYTNGLELHVTAWDSNNVVTIQNGVPYSGMGVDPKQWHHIVLEVFSGAVELFVNGQSRAVWALGTTQLDATPNKDWTYIGARYNQTTYFHGYMDDWLVGKAVPTACGGWGYLAEDLDENCYVGLGDFSLLAGVWMQCTDPVNPNCVAATP